MEGLLSLWQQRWKNQARRNDFRRQRGRERARREAGQTSCELTFQAAEISYTWAQIRARLRLPPEQSSLDGGQGPAAFSLVTRPFSGPSLSLPSQSLKVSDVDSRAVQTHNKSTRVHSAKYNCNTSSTYTGVAQPVRGVEIPCDLANQTRGLKVREKKQADLSMSCNLC